MQALFSFITDKANAVATYEAQGVERVGDKLWFSYQNKAGSNVSAYYDFESRSFKSVVRGKQYGKSGYAVRNLVARPVIESALGEWFTYTSPLGFNVRNYLVRLGLFVVSPHLFSHSRWGVLSFKGVAPLNRWLSTIWGPHAGANPWQPTGYEQNVYLQRKTLCSMPSMS